VLVANYGWCGKLGEPPVIWSEQGDEWLHHLGRSVAEVLPEHTVAGHRYDDTTKPFIEVSPQPWRNAGRAEASVGRDGGRGSRDRGRG